MSRLINADDLIAELEAACMPIYEEGLSGITGSTDTIADIINEQTAVKEKEPALSANSTSSEVASKDTDNIQFNGSTKEQICQAYDTVDEACTDIIDIYEGMSACERRAFDIEEVYGKICSTRDKLEKLRGGDSK
jgi:hypothetical protein